MILHESDIKQMEKRFRANLINTVAGLKPVNLIGTRDSTGVDNLAIITSVFHVGADPALQGMILRPNPPGTDRNTLDNIIDTNSYTINAVSRQFFTAAHQTSARYAADVSEFDETGLTPVYVEGITAPFVNESPIKIGLELREHTVLTINATHLIIGEIVYLDFADEALGPDGTLHLEHFDLVSAAGLDAYHSAEKLARMAYAKPGKPPMAMD